MDTLLILGIILLCFGFIILVIRICRSFSPTSICCCPCRRNRRIVAQTLDDEERHFASRFGIQLDQFQQIEEEYGLPEEPLPNGFTFSEADEVIEFDAKDVDPIPNKPSGTPENHFNRAEPVLTIPERAGVDQAHLTAQDVSEIELLDEMKTHRSSKLTAVASRDAVEVSKITPIASPERPNQSKSGRTRVRASGESNVTQTGTTSQAKPKLKSLRSKPLQDAPSGSALDNVSDSEFDANPSLRISANALEEEVKRMQNQPQCEGDDLIPL